MPDQWNEHLQCPQCLNVGAVDLSQVQHAPIPTVLFVSKGFKAVQTEFGPYFQCEPCEVPTLP